MAGDSVGEEFLECGGIRCGARGLELIQDGRIYREMAMGGIRRVILRYGLRARHLVMQMGFGGVLCAVGVVGMGFLSLGMEFIGAGLVTSGMLGVWVLMDAMRPGFFLVVEMDHGRDRCAFVAGVKGEEAERFLAEARERFGLPVESAWAL